MTRILIFIVAIALIVGGIVYSPKIVEFVAGAPPVEVSETEDADPVETPATETPREEAPSEGKQEDTLDQVVLNVPEGNALSIDVDGSVRGTIVIELMPDVAPLHVERIKYLAATGAYDNVAFHRVIDGFMAQTGDVENGKLDIYNRGLAGTGGSDLPDLPAEFSDIPFDAGVVGMARAQDPNSANSQFFIMLERIPSLDGQYTVVGKVVEGQWVVDRIKRGSGSNGSVVEPDVMSSVSITN